MAGQKSTVLKTYFEAGKAPTAAEFANLVDSLFEKKEHTKPFVASGFVSEVDLGSTDNNFRELHFGSATLWPWGRLKGTMHNQDIENIPSGNVNLSFSRNNTFYLRLTANTVISFPDKKIGVFTLIAEQDGAGGNNIIFMDVYQTGTIDTEPKAVNFITIICDHTNNYVIINK